MKSMLGKTYKVLPKTIGKKDPDIVALPSPDGSLNATFHQITYSKRKWADGNWYFPSTVVKKIDLPKPKNLNVIEDEPKPKNLDLEDNVEKVINKIAQRASKYKKIQAKKLMKSNKSKKIFS